jgi:broad specificity phosphatase PhoE
VQVFLVRHGATDWNLQGRCQGATDLDLNEVGVRQAERIAASLTNETIHGIYSSNLKRAQQTARFFSLYHQLPVLIETDVRELDHGRLEGLTFAEIKENYSQFIQKWRTEPAEIQVPGGERLVDVARRAWNGLNRIVHRHSAEETVVVVSHNFPILGIICRITGTHLNNYRTFQLDPCSVTRLNHNGGDQWQVTVINNQEYTPETPPARLPTLFTEE